MSDTLLPPLVSSAVLAATMIASGIAAIYLRPGKTLCTLILHFAGGMVFAIVSMELWPFVRQGHVTIAEGLGFFLGIAVLLGFRWLSHNAIWRDEQSSSTHPLPVNVLVETAENILIDGLVISMAFAATKKAGMLLTLVLAIEAISLGIAAATRSSKGSHAKRIALIFFLGSCYVIAAAAGAVLLRHLSAEGVLVALCSGAAALLFLATEEILVEARPPNPLPHRAAAFFAGYFVLLLLDGVVSGIF